jgi:heme/copper-type cytochrome/quinol oxidase subunit 2
MHKNKFINRFKELGWKVVTTIILTLTAVTTFTAYAVFTEPTSLPSASNQDFSKNILGANNADNGFDSSTVTSNEDGSIMEILEYIQSQL